MFGLVPWRERRRNLVPFDDDFDRFFDRFFDGFPFMESAEGKNWPVAVDVSETDKEVRVKAEIPGMSAKDFDISVHDGVLTIKGERKHESEDKNENYHRIERRYGSFYRSVRLPSEVDANEVGASYKNGVLDIRLPKVESEPVRKIEVK